MDVGSWLQERGLEQYAKLFADNRIGSDILPDLNDSDLKELGIPLGDRKRLLNAIATLSNQPDETETRDVVRESNAERRQLTVMFSDLVGSTALSSRLDPEAFRELILRYQDTCAEAIRAYDGYVARYLGDGALVYFGYPTAHEDDAERAVHTGLGIVDAIELLDAEIAAAHDIELAVRIGIATGPVVVGDIVGEGASQESTVLGETPNLAARLQTLAAPNTVMISDATRRLVEGQFVCEDQGPQELKGIPQPVTIYRVREATGAPGRFEAATAQHLTPLIGRESEVGLLLNRWDLAKEGEGQVAVLSAEAGIGKSRILRAFRDRLEDDKHNRILYYGSPYHRNSALYPVADQIERALRFRKDDDPPQKLDRLETVLTDLGLPVVEHAPVLASLLSLATNGRYPTVELPPEELKKRIFDAMLAIVEAMAERSPVLIVVEDLHWIDPTTLEFLNLMVERLRHSRVLFLGATRPEFDHPWAEHAHVTTLALNRLSRREIAALVGKVTHGKNLPDKVLDEIIAKTDGIPLFVEELTKTILESGLLQDAGDRFDLSGPLPPLAIPASLQDSLMARLDRLAPVKEVAQLAATLGRSFRRDVLAAVSTLSEAALDNALAQLMAAGLLYRRGMPPEVTYEFKHALVQDAAYESLLRRRREALHGAIAEAIETFDVERASEQTVLLAHHYARSAQPDKAIVYALRAGDASVQLHARVEATTHYLQALTIAQGLSESAEAQRNQIDAIVKLAAVSSSREDSERDADNLQQAQSLAEALADQPRLGQVLYWLGRVHYAHGELAIAAAYAEQSLAVADALGDEAMAAPSVNLLGRYYVVQGNVGRGSDMMARSVEQMHQIGDIVEEATAAGFAGFAYALKGDFAQGFAYADRGLALAQQLENPFAEAAAYHYRGIAHTQHGAWAEGIADFSKGREIAEAVGDGFRSYMLKGYESEAQIASGNLERAQELIDDAVAFAEKIGTKFNLGIAKRNRAAALLAVGERDSVLAACLEAIDVADEAADLWTKSRACKLLVDTWYRFDMIDDQEAEQTILEVIRIQQELGAEPELARSYFTYAHLLRRQGEMDKAKEYYDRAIDRFQRMGMVWDLAHAEQISADWV